MTCSFRLMPAFYFMSHGSFIMARYISNFDYHPICVLYSEPDRVLSPALSCRPGINLPLFCSFLTILFCSFCRQQFVVQHYALVIAKKERVSHYKS